MKNLETPQCPQLAGVASGLTSLTLDALSACCTQALRGAMPDFQLSAGRSLLQTIAYITTGKIIGADFNIKRETIPGVLALGISYMVSNMGVFGATTYLPLSEVQGIVTITSLVFTLLFTKIIFETDVRKISVLSAIVCVFGVLLVAQPHWLFKGRHIESTSAFNISELVYQTNKPSQYVAGTSCDRFLGHSLAIIGGAGTGLLYCLNGRVDLKPIVKASYGASLSLIGSLAFMFYMEEPVLVMGVSQAFLAFGHSVTLVVGSFLFFQAGCYIAGPAISLVYSFSVIAMLIPQYTIMHSIKPGNYNWIEVLGCLIIVSGASIQPVVDMLMNKAEAN